MPRILIVATPGLGPDDEVNVKSIHLSRDGSCWGDQLLSEMSVVRDIVDGIQWAYELEARLRTVDEVLHPGK